MAEEEQHPFLGNKEMSAVQGAGGNHPFGVSEEKNNIPMGMYPPITNQPGANTAGGDPTVNPGLQYLSMVDQLIVHQKIELMEVLLGCETKNKYTIKNSMGQPIFNAIEDTDCCTRNCLGPIRPFDLQILDSGENEVIHLRRDLRCDSCCCPCCLQRLEVYAAPLGLLGVVVQEWSILRPNLSVQTPDGETLFRIEGPLCAFSCCKDIDFPVYDASDGKNIGNITKQWSGLGREMFTDADHFGITFPIHLDVKIKAVLLGALFLIDFMYFEGQNSNR